MKQYFYLRDFFVFFFAILFFFFTSHSIYASTWTTSATLNSDFYIQVEPNQNISTTINVNTWADNSDLNDNDDWFSTQYTISGQSPICVNTPNHDSVGFYSENFNVLSPLTNGTYDITFKAFSSENCINGAINTPLTLSNAIIVVDSTPPETSILDKPKFVTKNINAEFTFSSNENSSFECKLDDQNFSPCDSPKNYLNLSSGSHTFSVRAIDMSSNTDTSPATYTWVIDNVSPIISVNSQITNNKMPKITGNIDDNTAFISAQINNKSYNATNNNNGTWDLSIIDFIPDSAYNIIVTATDLAGNVGTDSTSNDLVVDSVAPTATFKHYINGVEFIGNIARVNDLSKLSFTGVYTDQDPSSQLLQDSYVIFQAQNDGSFNFSQNNKKSYCSWRHEPNLVHLSNNNYALTTPELFTKCISDLPEGEYYMSHQVYDHAIRKDIPSITQFRDVLGLHFIIDKTSPVITLGTYSTAPTNQNITVTATTNEGTLNTTSHTFTENSSFNFIATDTAGNITTKTITISNIDKQKPSKPEILGFKNPNLSCNSFTNQKYVTIDWSDSTDNVVIAGYDYLIDYPKTDGVSRGNWQVYFTQSQYRGSLNEGLHNIKIRAKDTAGNVSDWSDICSITYDSIPPKLFFKTTFSDWYHTSQTSSFQYSDVNLLDNYTNPTCTISTEGANQTCSITPNICDKAGNCNTTLVISNSANIDKTIPTPTLTLTLTPTPTPTNQPTNSPTLTPTSSSSITPIVTNFPTPTINNQNQISDNQPQNNQVNNNSGQVLGESTTTKSGRWLPILFVIAFVFNFFYLKYSRKFLNLIPFLISSITFIIDWSLIKKYGCGVIWLSNYFWIGDILSWLIPIGIKNKIYQK